MGHTSHPLRSTRAASAPMRRAAALSLAAGIAWMVGAPPASAQGECSYEYSYIGNRPKEKNTGWHQDAQGLTHDDRSWFITNLPFAPGDWSLDQPRPRHCNTGGDCPNPTLWRIPAEVDLGSSVECGDPGDADAAAKPVCASLFEVAPALWRQGYDHYGDPSYFEHGGVGYVCVPLEGGLILPGGVPQAVAGAMGIFRADDLSYVAHAPVPLQGRTAAWCAIDPSGHLYSSTPREDTRTDTVFKYAVSWSRLAEDPPALELIAAGQLPLRDAIGDPVALHKHVQGGTFSGDGRLLYLLNGTESDDCDCGIFGFEVELADGRPCGAEGGDCATRLVARSHRGNVAFRYDYNPGFWTYEEPEGLTWWDLAAPGAPFVDELTSAGKPLQQSQLHALLLDNEASNDQVYVKHYAVASQCEPEAGIAVTPAELLFEDVDVGASQRGLVSAANTGTAELTLSGVALQPGTDPAFSLVAPPLPARIAPGASLELEVAFAPLGEELAQGAVEIASDAPNRPLWIVPLSGTGLGVEGQAVALLELFDRGVVDGVLQGAGPGRSDDSRLLAFRNMLEAVLDDLGNGRIPEACDQLREALRRSDGAPRPPDFMDGPETPRLNREISELRANLGCAG